MSFNIILYSNASPVNAVDKDIAVVSTVTGVLRTGASVTDPSITLDINVPANVVSRANYAYISEFSRYYYITGIVSGANGLWDINMHVDVLMTYKDQIREQSAIVARQRQIYNMYLDDGWFMAYQNPMIQTKYFSEPSPFEHEEYVLVIAGS